MLELDINNNISDPWRALATAYTAKFTVTLGQDGDPSNVASPVGFQFDKIEFANCALYRLFVVHGL